LLAGFKLGRESLFNRKKLHHLLERLLLIQSFYFHVFRFPPGVELHRTSTPCAIDPPQSCVPTKPAGYSAAANSSSTANASETSPSFEQLPTRPEQVLDFFERYIATFSKDQRDSFVHDLRNTVPSRSRARRTGKGTQSEDHWGGKQNAK